MGRHCSVFGCKSNYDGECSVNTFGLPNSDELKAKWLNKIPTDLSKIKNPVICIKHFHDNDIIRKDCVIYKGEYKEYDRKRPKLKEGAIPCIFQNAPSYRSDNEPKSHRLIDTEEENFNRAIQESLLEQKVFLEKSAVRSFNDIEKYIEENKSIFQKNWFFIHDNLMFRICLYDTSTVCPVVLGCIAISNDLKFEVHINNCKMNCSRLSKHRIINNTQILCQLVENVENFVKAPTLPTVLDSAICMLKSFDCSSDNSDNLDLIIEQLELLKVPPKYRPKIISTSNINIPLHSLLPDEDKVSIFSADDVDCYLNLLVEDFSLEHTAQDVLPVLAYISGYASMKELRITKCNICQNWLQTNTIVDVPDGLFRFIKELDRGKLIMPSELALLSSSIAHYLFSNILENFENDYLTSGQQLGILYKLSCIQLTRIGIELSETCNCRMVLQTRLENIILISCKVMLNNYTKHKNDLINVNKSSKKLKKF